MTYANHLLFIVQVVHIAAIPDIEHNAPHTIFANNMTATFNVVEACVQLNVKRFINISSEQVRVEPLPLTSSLFEIQGHECALLLRYNRGGRNHPYQLPLEVAVYDSKIDTDERNLDDDRHHIPQAPGFFSNHGPPGGAICQPKYCPVDEEHPMSPSNPYALSKHFGEQLCDAAVR